MGHLGFSPAYYPVPQNPITGMGGISDYVPGFFMTTTATDALASATGLPIPSMANWVVILGGLGILWFVTQPSGSAYRGERKKLRAKYAGYRQVTKKAGSTLSAI